MYLTQVNDAEIGEKTLYGHLGLNETSMDWSNRIGNIATAAMVGGAASALGGGKFANGAVTGAFSRLFNEMRVDHEFRKNLRKVLNNKIKANIEGKLSEIGNLKTRAEKLAFLGFNPGINDFELSHSLDIVEGQLKRWKMFEGSEEVLAVVNYSVETIAEAWVGGAFSGGLKAVYESYMLADDISDFSSMAVANSAFDVNIGCPRLSCRANVVFNPTGEVVDTIDPNLR